MTNYRRAFLAGGTYFFTVNLADRRASMLTAHIGSLRAAFRYTRRARIRSRSKLSSCCRITCMQIWSLPEGDRGFSDALAAYKSSLLRSRSADSASLVVKQPLSAKRERGIWQRRYWEHAMRDRGDFDRHRRLHPLQSASSTAMCLGSRIGRIRRFTGW